MSNIVHTSHTTLTGVVISIVARAFPAHIPRVKNSPSKPIISDPIPALSLTATRGIISLPVVPEAMPTRTASHFFAASAATWAHCSAV